MDAATDYLGISVPLAAQLGKVKTRWNSTQIRADGGHINLSGQCFKSNIEWTHIPCNFLVLQPCFCDVILGMEGFLTQRPTIIDFMSQLITFSIDEALNSNWALKNHLALSVPEEVSILHCGHCNICTAGNIHDNVEGNMQLLLDRGITIARGITQFRNGQSSMLITNLS